MSITDQSFAVFEKYAKQAGDWNGQPLVDGDAIERGNLTQLKKAGLIVTIKDDGCLWLAFTADGAKLAKDKLDITITNIE